MPAVWGHLSRLLTLCCVYLETSIACIYLLRMCCGQRSAFTTKDELCLASQR